MTTAPSPFASARPARTSPAIAFEAHIHSAHWRIDIDLFDGKKNSAMLMRHVEDPASLSAEDVKEPFNGGLEGGVDWDPKEFTMIRVECEKQNARGETIGYDLMPLRYGTPAAQRRVHAPRPVGQPRRIPSGRMEFIFANLPNIVKDEEVGRADRHRALDQLGRPPRAAARGRQAQLGAADLAGRRRLGRLGPGHVERLRPATAEPLRPDSVLSLHAPARQACAAWPGHRRRPAGLGTRVKRPVGSDICH